MRKTCLPLALVLLTVSFAFARSTKLVASWKNPSYPHTNFHKILVLGMSAKPGVRADFEDALSQRVAASGIKTVPGNTILLRPEGTHLELSYLKEQIQAFHIDAVIVSRLVKVDTKTTYIPGSAYVVPYPYYGSFYGYWGAVNPIVYTPDYLSQETTVRVETNVYAIGNDEGTLLWTGVSDTFNPSSAHKVIVGLSKLLVKELQKESILPSAK